jgi:ABC-2 type transport system ATP-binding protein
VVHEGRLVKELYAGELAEQEEQRLAVDVRDTGAALSVLGKAGITARPGENSSLVITDKLAVQYPDRIAMLLVEAGLPPTRLVVEQGDLESYFLGLVGVKGEKK